MPHNDARTAGRRDATRTAPHRTAPHRTRPSSFHRSIDRSIGSIAPQRTTLPTTRTTTTTTTMFQRVEKLRAALAKMPAASEITRNPLNGRVRAPEFSKRVVAELRKACVARGMAWEYDAERGVEKTKTRPGKGHKHDRAKPAREAKVAAALAKQPELIAGYKERLKSKAKGLDAVWDTFALTKREKVLKIRMQDVQGGSKG